MAKVHLDRLKDRYGWSGGKYEALMRVIIGQNRESIGNAVARIKVGRMKDEAKRLARRKKQPAQVSIPEVGDVLPKRSVFLRKGAEQGKLLSDSLRTRLAKDLRRSVGDFLKSGKGSMQYKLKGRAGRMNPLMIDQFQRQIKKTFEGYTKVDPEIGVPPNIRAIAVTETRSVVDDIKSEFANRLVQKNPGSSAVKRWVHNTHLVEEPRPGHRELDGKTAPLAQAFTVRRYDRVGTLKTGPNKGKGKWRLSGASTAMMHPHDPSAPADEVISCQCEVDYLFQFAEKP